MSEDVVFNFALGVFGVAISIFAIWHVAARAQRRRVSSLARYQREPERFMLLAMEVLGREPTLDEWARARQWYKGGR